MIFAAFDAGQLGVEPLELDGEAGIVDAEQVQHRGVEVVDVHHVLHRRIA